MQLKTPRTLKTIFCAAALAGSAGMSWAAPPDPVQLTPSGPGQLSGEFVQTVEGQFVDTFSFIPTTFDGLVSVTLSSLSGPVSFFTATLNDQSFSYFPDHGQDFTFAAMVSSAMPLMLTVYGAVIDADGQPTGSGSYHGAILAAVPEPQTYALLLAGLLGVGMVARRRRTNRVD